MSVSEPLRPAESVTNTVKPSGAGPVGAVIPVVAEVGDASAAVGPDVWLHWYVRAPPDCSAEAVADKVAVPPDRTTRSMPTLAIGWW